MSSLDPRYTFWVLNLPVLESVLCSSTMLYVFLEAPELLDTNGHDVRAVFHERLSDHGCSTRTVKA